MRARLGVIAATTLLGAAWLAAKGPVPVVRGTTPLEVTAPFWYMVSAFPVLGMLLADLLDGVLEARRSRLPRGPAIALAAQIAFVVVLSNLRLGVRLPVSGHALVACFFLFRRCLLARPVSASPLEVPFAAVALAATGYAKLVLWDDAVTLAAGAALAGALVGTERLWRRRAAAVALALALTLTLPLTLIPSAVPAARADVGAAALVAAARRQVGVTVRYDPAYRRLDYPGGDVPPDRGVCTDVLVRAYRGVGVDLQVLVHEDMTAHFAAYPKLWGTARPDRNIDHRRVPNLAVFLARHGRTLPVSRTADDYAPGDVVTWRLPSGVPHIGLVSDRRSARGTPLVIHNIGSGAVEEDVLFLYAITGHYRYFPSGPEAP